VCGCFEPASSPCYIARPSTGILVSRFCQRNTSFLQEMRGFQPESIFSGPTLVSFPGATSRIARAGGQIADPGRLAQVVSDALRTSNPLTAKSARSEFSDWKSTTFWFTALSSAQENSQRAMDRQAGRPRKLQLKLKQSAPLSDGQLVSCPRNTSILPEVSWLFFKGRAKRPYLAIRVERANAEKHQLAPAQRVADENGPAAALLVGHVSVQICSLLTPCRRPIFDRNKIPRISGTGH